MTYVFVEKESVMRIIVIGATGTIGIEVGKALSAHKHEVIGASRKGDFKVNLEDAASIEAMFEKIRGVDAVVSCAGNAAFGPFPDLTDADYEVGLRSKLMGQVSLARIAKDHLNEGGSVTLTSGSLATHPMPGSASVSLVNAGLEGFVRAAALEMPRKLRINAVSPPWVKETLVKLGMDPGPGLAAAEVAKAYIAAVEGPPQGTVLDPRQLGK
jgi:NAD(P)-dependent dehydrogenase (short-subunit alcohol dehydrogenase family)